MSDKVGVVNGNGRNSKSINWIRLAEAVIIILPIVFFFVDIVNRQAGIEKSFAVFKTKTETENVHILKKLDSIESKVDKLYGGGK